MATITVWIRGDSNTYKEYTDTDTFLYDYRIEEGHLQITRQKRGDTLIQVIRVLPPGEWTEVEVEYTA